MTRLQNACFKMALGLTLNMAKKGQNIGIYDHSYSD